MRSTAIALALVVLTALPAANAQRRGPAARGNAVNNTARTTPTLTIAQARDALQSGDRARVEDGLDSLRENGSPEAVQAIVDYLRSGPPDPLTDLAVERLGGTANPAAIEELSNLLHHRRPAVRRAALGGLARIRDERVRALIESGLEDSDREVRADAAAALGEISARASVPLLFRAFERGVTDAAESIGRVGEAQTAVSTEAAWDREDPRTTRHPITLAMWLGRRPLSVLLRGFERFLSRNDIPVATKEQIIVRLEQQASAEVRTFLERWVRSLPAGYRGRDRARAELAIRQIRVPSGGAQ